MNRFFTVEGEEGERIDKYLAGEMEDVTRSPDSETHKRR